MSDVAQADCKVAANIISEAIGARMTVASVHPAAIVIATYRIAAEKAMLDRLRGWTDDDHEYLGTGITQAQADVVADALAPNHLQKTQKNTEETMP